MGEFADRYHRALAHLYGLFYPQVTAANNELRVTLSHYPHPIFMPEPANERQSDESLLFPIINLYHSLSRRLIAFHANSGSDMAHISKELGRNFREAPLVQWIEAQHELVLFLCRIPGAVSVLHSEGIAASAEPIGSELKRREGLTKESRNALWEDWQTGGHDRPNPFAWRVLAVIDASVLRDWEQKCRAAKLPLLSYPQLSNVRALDQIAAKLDWLQHLLIHLNLPLARSRVRAWSAQGKRTLLTEDELRSFASEGLLNALNKYYPASGSLSTLIYMWIRHRLRRAAAQQGHLIGRTLEAEELREAIQVERLANPKLAPKDLAKKLRTKLSKIEDALAIPTVAREVDLQTKESDDDRSVSAFDRAVESAEFDRPAFVDARTSFEHSELVEDYVSMVKREFTPEEIVELAHLGLYGFREAREHLTDHILAVAEKRVRTVLGPDPKRRHPLKRVLISRSYQGSPPRQPDGGGTQAPEDTL
jgi:hypothetical protein